MDRSHRRRYSFSATTDDTITGMRKLVASVPSVSNMAFKIESQSRTDAMYLRAL